MSVRASARALVRRALDRAMRTLVEGAIRTMFEEIGRAVATNETPSAIELLVAKFADTLDAPTVEKLAKVLTPAQAAIVADLWRLDSQKRKSPETTNGVSA